jgi:hypothetical protein
MLTSILPCFSCTATAGKLASLLLLLLLLCQVDWFFTREQEASTEALAHRWDPAGSAAVARLEAFLEQVRHGMEQV